MRPTIVRLDDLLLLRARTHGGRPAIVSGGRATTYVELERAAQATARRLAALRIGPGDRIATTLPAGLEFARLLHAAPMLGAVLAPLSTRVTAAERAAQLKAAGARLLVEEPLEGPEEDLDPRPPNDAERPWTLLFSSGTTGSPKPILLSRRNHLASAIACAWNLGVSPDDRWLCVLPPFHVGGLSILIRSAVYGTAAVLHERFDPDRAIAEIADGAVTVVSLVPTMLRRLVDAGLRDPGELRAVLLGGAPAPRDLLRWAAGVGLPVISTYGMTETASQIAASPARAETGGPDDAGARPLPGVELDVAPDGEVLVRGPMVAAGSVGQDGWLHTGDRGCIDEHGALHVEGRIDEVVITGGEKVPAREVEDALLEHAAVSDAAVVGIPDREWGEAVAAFVVLRPGAALSQTETIEHCRGRLAGFKVPKLVRFVDELPRNAAGKLVRGELRTAVPSRRRNRTS